MMKESLDLVVAHMQNDETSNYLKTVMDEKSCERWTMLQEVCWVLGRDELIEGVEGTVERRKLEKL